MCGGPTFFCKVTQKLGDHGREWMRESAMASENCREWMMFGGHLDYVGWKPKSVGLAEYEGDYVNGNILLVQYMSTNHLF